MIDTTITPTYVRAVGRLTVLSGLVAAVCNVLCALVVDLNFDAFANPSLIFNTLSGARVAQFRWAMITDLWGYYLLFVPAVLLITEHVATPWRKMLTVAGVAYALIGAAGAAVLAATGTYFLREFLGVGALPQLAARDNFLLVYHVVNNGLWNLLEMGLLGVFLLGVAPVIRQWSRKLSVLTILLGLASILDAVGHTLEIVTLSSIGLNTYLALEPVWAIWLGGLWMGSPKGAS